MFRSLIALLVLSFALTACNNDDDNFQQLIDQATPETALLTNQRTGSVNEIYGQIKTGIELAEGPTVMAEVNHSQAAAGVGLDLRPTRLIFFGNPEIGTQFMQQNQLAGLDLPLRMQVYQDSEDRTLVTYRNAAYLTKTYDITLVNVENNVNQLLADLADRENPDPFLNQSFDSEFDILTTTSANSFEDSYAAARDKAVELGFTVLAEFDHGEAAANVGLDLDPTRVLVFGNPAGGTQLMQVDQQVGYDLPLKLLVWQDANGVVYTSYYNGSTLADRYDLSGVEEVIGNVNDAYAAIVEAATE